MDNDILKEAIKKTGFSKSDFSSMGINAIKEAISLTKQKTLAKVKDIFNNELKWRSHQIVDGRVGEQRIKDFKEGEEAGYNLCLKKIKKIEKEIEGLNG